MAKEKLGDFSDISLVVLETRDWLISDDVIYLFEIAFSVPLHGVASWLGVISNFVSMVIFAGLGIKDSMTAALFALSLTDFLNSLLQLIITACYLAGYFYLYSPVDFWSLAYVTFGWAVYAGYLISDWITTLISLERCACVAWPFKVKRLFTRRRCVVAVAGIYAVHVVIVLPIYVVQKWGWEPCPSDNEAGNRTIMYLMYTALFDIVTGQTETVIDIAGGMFLSFVAQALLVVCTLYMAWSLRNSSSIRKELLSRQESDSIVGNDKASKPRLKAQERRLIKIAYFLSVLLTLCNLPRLAVGLFHHTYQGVTVGAYKNLNTLLWAMADLFMVIYCSCNSIGYFFLHTSYRKQFCKIFRL